MPSEPKASPLGTFDEPGLMCPITSPVLYWSISAISTLRCYNTAEIIRTGTIKLAAARASPKFLAAGATEAQNKSVREPYKKFRAQSAGNLYHHNVIARPVPGRLCFNLCLPVCLLTGLLKKLLI